MTTLQLILLNWLFSAFNAGAAAHYFRGRRPVAGTMSAWVSAFFFVWGFALIFKAAIS